MKLSKKKLIQLVKPELENLGFTEFVDSKSGWQGLFCKKISHKLFLTIGLTIHRFYDSAFTANFYLSKTTMIGVTWGDIPDKCYLRPSFLLTEKERSIYPENEINVKDSYDVWWDGNNEKSVMDFLRTIELTEPRFVNQPELLKQIEESKDLLVLSEYVVRVINMVSTNSLERLYKYLPSKELDGIPMDYFKASEEVLSDSKTILNSYTVIRLAADSYRQKQLD